MISSLQHESAGNVPNPPTRSLIQLRPVRVCLPDRHEDLHAAALGGGLGIGNHFYLLRPACSPPILCD